MGSLQLPPGPAPAARLVSGGFRAGEVQEEGPAKACPPGRPWALLFASVFGLVWSEIDGQATGLDWFHSIQGNPSIFCPKDSYGSQRDPGFIFFKSGHSLLRGFNRNPKGRSIPIQRVQSPSMPTRVNRTWQWPKIDLGLSSWVPWGWLEGEPERIKHDHFGGSNLPKRRNRWMSFGEWNASLVRHERCKPRRALTQGPLLASPRLDKELLGMSYRPGAHKLARLKYIKAPVRCFPLFLDGG